MYAQKRDKNEAPIVEALRAVGAYVQQMDKSAGFDLLVVFRRMIYIAEVKTEKGKLTFNEAKVKDEVEWAGGTYYIIRSIEQAYEMIGLEYE